MTKRLVVVLGIIFVLMMTGCGNSNSAEDSAEILQEYLTGANKWESDYVLEPLDPVLGEIENEKIFRFEIRYTDDMEEVGGRLIDNYAITTDGQKIFRYNPADDEWVQQNFTHPAHSGDNLQ